MPKKVMIPVVILVVILAAGAAVYWFILRDTGGEQAPERYNYAIGDSFVTNVKDSSRLFKATVVLVVDKNGLDEFLDENQYIVRDTILFILRGLTEEDIKSEHVQDTLRVSIPEALNQALGIENVVSVYFSDFVMQ